MAAQSDLDKKQLAGTALNNVLGAARSVKTASQGKVATELRLEALAERPHRAPFISFRFGGMSGAFLTVEFAATQGLIPPSILRVF